jgi:hypothetical protein
MNDPPVEGNRCDGGRDRFLFTNAWASSRRWQTHALRAVGVLALLLAVALIASSQTSTQAGSWRDCAELGRGYFIALIGVELAIVLLAPTAGAICELVPSWSNSVDSIGGSAVLALSQIERGHVPNRHRSFTLVLMKHASEPIGP